MFEEDDYFDEELDLCLGLLSEKVFEPNLYKLLNRGANQWINMKKHILPKETEISENIEVMWFFAPYVNDYSAIVILFINKETLEISNGIYYNYNDLMKRMNNISSLSIK